MRLESWPLHVLCVAAVFVGVARGQSWDRFRGPNGTGTCAAANLPSTLAPDQNVSWKIAASNGSSSPIVSGDALYFTSYEGNARRLHCVDAATGKTRWQRAVEKTRDETASRPNGPATCTPVTDGQHVVVFYPDTALLCYSTSGALLWRTEVGPFHSMHGIANSPILVRNLVIQMIDQLQESYIAAYDLTTGKPAWKVDRIDGLTGGYSTPSLYVPQDGDPLIVASGARGLYGYHAASGDAAWSVPGVANAPVTVPVMWQAHAILCEPVGTVEPITMLAPLDKNKDRKSVPYVSSPVVYDDVLYFIRDGGILTSVDPASGKVLKRARLKKGGRKYYASPVAADGKVFLIDTAGQVTVVRAAGSDWAELSTATLGEPCFATPAIAGNRIYVRTAKTLYCFAVPTE